MKQGQGSFKKTRFHSPLHIPEEMESGSVWTREWEWQNETAGVGTICLLSWHSGMIIHFNGEAWECFYERVDPHNSTGAVVPQDAMLNSGRTVQSKPEEGAHLWDVTDEKGGGRVGVGCERSAGNYGRRQFRSNQREIWRGLGRGLIGAGTQLCIHLSMRGLHRQSSPSWPNQSPHLTATSSTSFIPILRFSCTQRFLKNNKNQ